MKDDGATMERQPETDYFSTEFIVDLVSRSKLNRLINIFINRINFVLHFEPGIPTGIL